VQLDIKSDPQSENRKNTKENSERLSWLQEHAMAQLVEALRYKPEGRGFDSRWCHWNILR